MGVEINNSRIPDPNITRREQAPPQPQEQLEQAQTAESPKAPPQTSAPNQLGTTAPGSATASPTTANPQPIDIPLPNPANKASDQAWGAMGATALSNSGPKAVPGSENTIDTDAERAHSDLKRTVTEFGIKQALKSNGAPDDQLDALTKSVVDKMFRGEGETPGGNVGFALAQDGGIVHKGADGKEYYEFGIGGEGSSLDLNGDGKNDISRQFFKVDKSLLDGPSGSTVPITEADLKDTKPQLPIIEAKSTIVPSSSELGKMADVGIQKLQKITQGVIGEGLSDSAAKLASAYTDSVLRGPAGILLDAAKPGLEAGAQKVQELANDLSQTKEQIQSLSEKAFDAVKDAPELAKALSPTLSGLSSIAKLASELSSPTGQANKEIVRLSVEQQRQNIADFKEELNSPLRYVGNPVEKLSLLNEGDKVVIKPDHRTSSVDQISLYKVGSESYYDVGDEGIAGKISEFNSSSQEYQMLADGNGKYTEAVPVTRITGGNESSSNLINDVFVSEDGRVFQENKPLTPNANGDFTLGFADADPLSDNRFQAVADRDGNLSFIVNNPIERALSIAQIKSLIRQ